jgi:hypothetical protein
MGDVNDAEKIVEALLENDELDPKDEIDNLADDVLTDEEDERSKFAVRVEACVERDGNVYQLVDMPEGTQPEFWTVYKRIFNYDEEGQEHVEALEFAIRDYNTPEEAHQYAEHLKELYRAEGKLIEDEG